MHAPRCDDWNCFWFSGPVHIPHAPTLNDPHLRTYNVHVASGGRDWSASMPWRSPGAANVYGSGCGAAGGGPTYIEAAGNIPPPGYKQGADALHVLPPKPPAVWRRGADEEVAWFATARR